MSPCYSILKNIGRIISYQTYKLITRTVYGVKVQKIVRNGLGKEITILSLQT